MEPKTGSTDESRTHEFVECPNDYGACGDKCHFWPGDERPQCFQPRSAPCHTVGATVECIGCELGWEIVDGRHRADVYSEARGRTDDIPCTSIPARTGEEKIGPCPAGHGGQYVQEYNDHGSKRYAIICQVEECLWEIRNCDSRSELLAAWNSSSPDTAAEREKIALDAHIRDRGQWIAERDALKAELAEEQAHARQQERLRVGAESEVVRLREENAAFRKFLWLAHGHVGLYGDDGEQQCGLLLPTDFKRDSAERLKEHTMAALREAGTELSSLRESNRELVGVLRDIDACFSRNINYREKVFALLAVIESPAARAALAKGEKK